MAKEDKEGRKSTRSFDLKKEGNRSFELEKKSTHSFDLKKDNNVEEAVVITQPATERQEHKPVSSQQQVKKQNTQQPVSKPTTQDNRQKPQGKTPTRGDVGNTKNDNKSSNGRKWLWGLIGVAAIAGVIWLFSGKDGNTIDAPQYSAPTLVSDSTANNENADNSPTMGEESEPIEEASAGNVDSESSTQSEAQPSVQNPAKDQVSETQQNRANAETTAPSQTTAFTVTGTVQEIAKDVIYGKYGNVPERRAALGNRYEEIQREVNRMYRSGEVQ